MFGEPMILTEEPSPEDVQFLEDQINEHNMVRTGRRDFRPLGVFLRDDQGSIIGGLYGFTWAGWLEIKFVWVREDLRGHGHGRRLIETAEAEARARGCQRVWLDGYAFQAPTFYQRLGYQVFGLLQDDPAPYGRVSSHRRSERRVAALTATADHASSGVAPLFVGPDSTRR